MDALTRILELARVRGALDLRCQLAGGFSLDHEDAGPGEAPFHLVLAGEGVMELPGRRTLDLRAGDLVVLPHGTSHRVRDTHGGLSEAPITIDTSGPLAIKRSEGEGEALDLLCGRFVHAPDAGPLLFASLPDTLHASLLGSHGIATLEAIVNVFRVEVGKLAPGALAVVTALSQALLVFALRAQLERGTMPPSLLTLLADPRLGRALLAMLRDPAHEWTVESLAAQAAMSRATFARHFEAKGKQSPHEVLTLIRMHLAAELLRRGELTAAAVADRVGYRSESAFGKTFLRIMGTTPARFRRDVD
ncbi:AraC family transcriptional regulator [Luteibacter aegosomaticola]|uniref:cupin domain-containing protein n=1 Tax=Luteibacter aegosomaticola TaxID=2911538 RepID=UPI001FFB3577|nr:AraC family transcriptional regulator [Luteibacter aegosomaticola]UPG92101.1 AraC family transcriptional regulator [Luteibacter aegosomaticola]